MKDLIAPLIAMIVALFLVALQMGILNDRVATLQEQAVVTPQQLDSALVEAAYRLLSERDSMIRECVKKLGPLNPECRRH